MYFKSKGKTWEETVAMQQKAMNIEPLIFGHYLSAWLYCFKQSIPFKPVRLNFRQWTIESNLPFST